MKLIILLLSLCVTLPGLAASFIVELDKKFDKKDIKRLKKVDGVVKVEPFTTYSSDYFDRLLYVETSDKFKMEDLKTTRHVKLVENDFKAQYFEIRINKNSEMIIDDLLFPQQWGLYNQEQIVEKRSLGGSKIITPGIRGVDINWKDGIDAIESKLMKDPVVAVVDMGIDLSHPELVDSIYKNEKECDESLSVPMERADRDGNGLANDCHGWNFAATDLDEQFYPTDDKGHGTHVSGIISAKKNDKLGIGGVSDKIKILPVRVTGMVDETTLKNSLLMLSPSRRIANGILYAIRMNVDVINLSLGWPKSMDTNFMRNVIKEATSKGIVVVAAAGNDHSPANIYPCNYYDVICVGSVDIDGKMSMFSNYGGQVDILAPGDQIVSTIPTTFIPLKLNIQGYDILSGTSQAAPFVSAAAALLRGVNPEMSLDEIKNRLYKTARNKIDPEKSKHGLLNLTDSFQAQSGANIVPVFKELSQVLVNPENGIVQFPLYFKNFGDTAANIEVKLESKIAGVEVLSKLQKIDQPLETGKPVALGMVARLRDFNSDHNFKFRVSVKVGDSEWKKFDHAVTLGLDVTKLPQMNLGFKFEGAVKPIIIQDNETGEYRDFLNTVDEKIEDGMLPSYYMVQSKLRNGAQGISLTLFNFDGVGFRESKETLEIKNALKFLSITKADFNYDGKKDILVKTIVCLKDCKDDEIQEKNLTIRYSYRTLDNEPLVGAYSDLDFRSEQGINVTSNTIRHYKEKLPNGSFLALPYFITQGPLPDNYKAAGMVKLKDENLLQTNDLNTLGNDLLSMFRKKDTSVMRRIYRLALKPGEKKLIVRSFVDRDFIKAVRFKMQNELNQRIALEDSQVAIIQFLKQDREDFYGDNVKALVSFGLGSYQYNLILEINESKYDLVSAPSITQPLLGNSDHKYFVLSSHSNQYSQSAFVSFTTSNLMTISGIRNSGDEFVLPYRLRDTNDLIMGFLALFEMDDKINAFIEQVDNLSLVSFDKNTQEYKTLKTPTQKFSFLPGQVMTEMYYPVVIENSKDKKLEPAIYIDNTMISSNQVFLKTQIENELIAPVRSSLFLPNNCKTKNPIMGQAGHHLFTFLCRDENGFRLKYVKMFK